MSNKNHPRFERSLVVIKPDGIQRSLMGEIIGRLERVGLKLVALKMLIPTKDHIEKHYMLDPEWKRKVGEKAIEAYVKKGQTPPSTDPIVAGNKVLNALITYITSGPVVAIVWQGAHVVPIVRKIVGGTEPLSSDVGTIRGDFCLDTYSLSNAQNRPIRNLIHASGTEEEANKEIPVWFTDEELYKYEHVNDRVQYDPEWFLS